MDSRCLSDFSLWHPSVCVLGGFSLCRWSVNLSAVVTLHSLGRAEKVCQFWVPVLHVSDIQIFVPALIEKVSVV